MNKIQQYLIEANVLENSLKTDGDYIQALGDFDEETREIISNRWLEQIPILRADFKRCLRTIDNIDVKGE